MKLTKSLLGAAPFTVAAAGTASAAAFATNPSGSWVDGGSVVTIGTQFSVGDSPIAIKALGIFDQNDDGLEYSEQVGIFDLSKNLLGTVTVKDGTGSPLRDGTRWENLATTITLDANTTYLLAWTTRQNGVPLNLATGPYVTIDPAFKLESTGYYYTDTGVPGLHFTSQNERSPQMYAFGGNMELLLVPEPAAVGVLAGMALLGFGAWRRRASRQA
ncbi:MAG: DUF4082 domain-containing protein [Verrucomicrobia bacterium]|nr:DUF4082 domain-containing protein [Verrucomicrobiota bacterium]